MARLNLALALFHDQDLEGANREATEARRLLPAAPEPSYVLGLVARADNRPDDAAQAFTTVLESDPADVGANINLGQIHLESQDYPAAIEHLRVAYEREPFNITAVYNLGLALARSGDADEGRQLLEEAQALRPALYATTYGPGYLNEGRYAEAIASTGAEAVLVDTTLPSTSFVSRPLPSVATDTPPVSPFGRAYSADELSVDGARALADGLGGGVTPIDVDGDGDLDLFFASPEGQQLLRNDGDRWTDMTAVAGLVDAPSVRVPLGAVAGDFDNDHLPDLFVLRYGESTLYRNGGDGRFEDVTLQAGIDMYPHLPGAAAFGDVDHDGDIDLLIAGLADLVTTRESLGKRRRGVSRRFRPGATPALAQRRRRHLHRHHRGGSARLVRSRRGHRAHGLRQTDGTSTCWWSITTARPVCS